MGETAERDVQAELDEQERLFTQWVGEWHRTVALPPTAAASVAERAERPVHTGGRSTWARLRARWAG